MNLGLDDSLVNLTDRFKFHGVAAREELDGLLAQGYDSGELHAERGQIYELQGGLEEAGEDFLNHVASEVRQWAFKESTNDLKIFYSQLKENAVALGAASLVMQKMFAQLW